MKKLALLIIACQATAFLHSPSLPAADLSLGYSTYLGGSNGDVGYGIALGTGGEIYITGATSSDDFPMANPYQGGLQGVSSDIFVSKLSSSGSSLIYSTYLGGSEYDSGEGLVLGPGGEAYVAGYTASSNFPTVNPYQASFNSGTEDAFVSKLSSSGSSLVYSTYLGGSDYDFGNGIALGSDGEAYVTGSTNSFNFPTANPYQATHNGGLNNDDDAFVSKLSSTGSFLIYSTYLGGSYDINACYDAGEGIALGTGGEAYVTGRTSCSDFPIVNPYQAWPLPPGWSVPFAFVTKLSPSGSSLIYSTYLGGSGIDGGKGIALGTGGEAYVTGETMSLDFPTVNPYQATFGTDPGQVGWAYDAFVSKLSSSGSSLVYSTYLGGFDDDEGKGIALGTGGEAYVTGRTDSSDFPTINPYQAIFGGYIDAFLSALESSGSALIYSTYLGGDGVDVAYGIALGAGGEAYVTGKTGSDNFPIANPYQPGNSGSGDAFISKLVLAPLPPPSISYLIDSGDYNGDGTSDIAIFRGSTGMWSVRNFTRAYFGNSTDSLVPADYNGDGTTDIAIFRGSSGMWSVRNISRFYLGIAGDVPVPGDYVGNGTAVAGLFRASGGMWAIRNVTRAYFGSTGDSVVPGYYNSDSIKDIAIFRGSTGMWSVRGISRFYFGAATDDLVPGDYNGMGKWEGGIFRPSSGMWSIRNVSRFYLGNSTDWALPADYNGDGIDDAGVFRDSNGMWAVRNLTRVYFGSTNDIPVTR